LQVKRNLILYVFNNRFFSPECTKIHLYSFSNQDKRNERD